MRTAVPLGSSAAGVSTLPSEGSRTDRCLRRTTVTGTRSALMMLPSNGGAYAVSVFMRPEVTAPIAYAAGHDSLVLWSRSAGGAPVTVIVEV
jgi:hypothetical protein